MNYLPECSLLSATIDTIGGHGGYAVNSTIAQKTQPALPVIPPEIHATIVAANAGDRSVIPALRQALAEHPDLVVRFGDLASHVEMGLIARVTQSSLVASEAITAHLAKMRSELNEVAASPLEKLLIRRVVLCWLSCHAAEVDRADLLREGGSESARAAADKRVDRAHARFLSATKALATLRKLMDRTPSALDLARAVLPEARPKLLNRVRGRVGVSTG